MTANKRLRIEYLILAVLVGVLIGRSSDLLARNGGTDFVDKLVDIRSILMDSYVEKPDGKALRNGAIEGMLNTLDDPHTTYLSPDELKEFETHTRAEFSGIGARIQLGKNEQLTIVTPLEGSPALKAGIMPGDVILKIEGKSAKGLGLREAVEQIRGKTGTKVDLKVRHPDGETETITITRGKIEIKTVRGFARQAGGGWDYMLDDKRGIGYIRLTQFAKPTAGKLRKRVQALRKEGLKALILDLRFNPGGVLEQGAIPVADLFLDSGKIVSTRGRASPEKTWKADSNKRDLLDLPLMVVVNGASASASEIVAGALKDNDRAVVVGTRTWGKGSVQQVKRIPSGGALKLTTAHYYLPSGRNISRQAVGTGRTPHAGAAGPKKPGAGQGKGGKAKKKEIQRWGVDPTTGYYVPMSQKERTKMLKLRRKAGIVRPDSDDPSHPESVGPRWLKKKRSDPQLAAALEAMVHKLEKGEFRPTGKKVDADLLANLNRRRQFKSQEKALRNRLDELDKKLKKINQRINSMKEQGEKVPRAKAPRPGEKKSGDKKGGDEQAANDE